MDMHFVDMHFDISPAPGRYPFPLTSRWTVVAIEPLPGVVALGLFLDGEPVEVVTEPDEVAAYLHAIGSARSRTRARSSASREAAGRTATDR